MIKKALTGLFFGLISALLITYAKFEYVDKKFFVLKQKDQRIFDAYDEGYKTINSIIQSIGIIYDLTKNDYYVNPKVLEKKLVRLNNQINEYSKVYSTIDAFASDSLVRINSKRVTELITNVNDISLLYIKVLPFLEKNSKELCVTSISNDDYLILLNQRKVILSFLINKENSIRSDFWFYKRTLECLKNNFAYSHRKFLTLDTLSYKLEDCSKDFNLNYQFSHYEFSKIPFLRAKQHTSKDLSSLVIDDKKDVRLNKEIELEVLNMSLPDCR
ncbi:hypothetical protein PL373_03755 [Tenacibaculum maritimum]|nr:hypothetical protein [Tenacibaculum maritimum]MDB0600269.1 hypothetical protein [Tenacibaculum maritimum]MDB0610779.1 hypothetical protein [Tenacibaculum maritimum]